MKVTTSCSGRFHIFDQARQLHRCGVLHRFVNDYPKWMTRRWGIPDARVTSLLANGVLGRAARYLPASWSPTLRDRLYRTLHNRFSARLARHVPRDSDIFIGLSSFCLDALERAKDLGVTAIVDHGSLHQRTERRLLEEESRLHGIKADDELATDWLIDKEDCEFHTADRVFVLSEAAKRSLVDEGIAGDKIFVNPCGVDVSQFRAAEKGDSLFRVIYCGNIRLGKGVHYLLQAFSELRLANAELCLIGDAPVGAYGELIRRFQASNVRFLGTFPQVELAKIYTQGSVLVLPSVADGFGMVVPQAMACGVPVIVTQNVGAADIVSEGVDGFVVPIRDVAALKERLRLLHEQPVLQRQMGAAAQKKANASLSWDEYGNRLVAQLKYYLPTSSYGVRT